VRLENQNNYRVGSAFTNVYVAQGTIFSACLCSLVIGCMAQLQTDGQRAVSSLQIRVPHRVILTNSMG
jgi:hypothetical protein